MIRRTSLASAPSGKSKAPVIGVSIDPGHTALARRPCLAYSMASVRVRASTPPFDAEQAGPRVAGQGGGRRHVDDGAAAGRASPGMAAWQNRNVPVRLTRAPGPSPRAATSWLCSKRRMPALFTRTSSRPGRRRGDGRRAEGRVADVAGGGDRAGRGAAPWRWRQAVGVAVDGHDRGALVDQPVDRRPADARRRTRDDGDPSLESLHGGRLERVLVRRGTGWESAAPSRAQTRWPQARGGGPRCPCLAARIAVIGDLQPATPPTTPSPRGGSRGRRTGPRRRGP